MNKLLVIGAGVVVVAAVGAGVVAVSTRDDGPAQTIATVTQVVSGDTLTVDLKGTPRTIHLIDLTVPSEAAGDCLGRESSQQLTAFAPAGTKVRLEVGGAPLDPASAGDTVEAAVFLDDGRLLNAAMAGEGLAYLPTIAASDTYRWEVQRAQELARTAGLGLYSTEVDCTIPAQVLTVAEKVELAPLAVDTHSAAAALSTQRSTISALMTEADALVALVTGTQTGAVWDALRTSDRITYTAEAERAVTRLQVADGQLAAALGQPSAFATSQG